MWSPPVYLAFALVISPTRAQGGGFDTPIMFTARHTAMGGAAVGYADDATAVFHNPAGLIGIPGAQLAANLSLVVGSLQTSPDHDDQNASTGNIWAPVPLIAAGARLHPRVALGLAAYPVAAGGAAYTYRNVAGVETMDRAHMVFMEVSPAMAVSVGHGLSLGLGYRVSTLDFARQKGPMNDPGIVDVRMSGTDWRGVRLGLRWQPDRHWQVGATYRHAIDVDIDGDTGRAFFRMMRDPRSTVRLPAKLAIGGRADYGRVGVAADVEYGLQSQNDSIDIEATLVEDNQPVSVPFVFRWRDAVIVHTGVEVRVTRKLAARAGYAYDGAVTNPAFPSAFSTPPTANHSVTGGAGYRFARWQLNAAVAYRTGAADIAREDIASTGECPLCGNAGRYAAKMMGLWIDFSVDL